MKHAVFAVLISIILGALCGCDAWTGGEYLSVTPHEAQAEDYADRVIEVTSYTQLRNAVANLVRTGASEGIISISAFNKGTIHFYVDTAISNVIENTAFGSYAVENITYEIGTNRGVSVVACKVHYRSGYKPPSQIERIGGAGELSDAVEQALENRISSVLVHMEQYEKIDIAKIVEEYSSAYPDRIVEVPELSVSVYPEKGAERIVEINFQYHTDLVLLRQIQGKVEDYFRAAEKSIQGLSSTEEIYEQLFVHLTEGFQYSESIFKIPAFTFFEEGKGDDKVLAEVYARICTRIGLDCQIVAGTKNGQSRIWNTVQIRGKHYNIDLLDCFEKQNFRLLTNEQLEGYYGG